MKFITREEIKKKIEEILLDHYLIEQGEEVHERHSYADEYGMDSLDHVELVMDLEKEYCITIPDDAADRMDTVARTIDYLHLTLNKL